MADEENEVMETEAAPEPAAGGVLDLNSALQAALKKALVHDGVARGLRECVKSLDRRQAHLCILAGDCDSAEYVRLVEALAQERSISLIKVPDGKQLGEWVGLAKLDREGKPRKVVKCSCAVIRDCRTVTNLKPGRRRAESVEETPTRTVERATRPKRQ